MKLLKYEKYKASGVEWLGEIPEHWMNQRIDWITALVRGNTGFKKDELLDVGEYVALQYGKTYKVDEVNNTFNYFVNSEFYKNSQIVNRGDTILISTSETIEDLGHSCFYSRSDLGLIGGEQILLKPKSRFIDEKYLYYFSKVFCVQLRKYSTGLKVFRFNIDDLKEIFIAIPLLEEQTAIAHYLDAKTSNIDKKIDLLTKKIAHYQELRKSLINETVCRGLDKSIKLKESGIEWIGKVPEHWEVSRFSDYIYNNKKTNKNLKETNLLSLSYGKIIRKDFETSFGLLPASFDTYQIVEEGNIILRLTDLQNDKKSLRVGFVKERGMITSAYIGLILNKIFDPAYAFYLLYDFDIKKVFYWQGGSMRQTMKFEDFKSIPFLVPPKSEQTAIATYLDTKTQTIDNITNNLKKQIDTLKELRKTLINDVVTGKIKVNGTSSV